MPEDFSHLNEDERLKAENEFIKVKLMLEKGASFSEGSSEGLPAEIENEFLRNIMEFEQQHEEHKTIKVFDKIGRPAQFKPAEEIPEEEIEKAWEELSDKLGEFGISLDVCSPNISKRELYRFTVEELFDHEMDDMSVPGMMHGFIYDEFHPDLVYDNTKIAKEDCINYILEKQPMEWAHHFRKEKLRLNHHYPLEIVQFKNIINQFKLAYDNLEIIEITETNCEVKGKESRVKGTYSVMATSAGNSLPLSGNWKVDFELDEKFGYWYIHEVIIEGIGF